MQVRIVCFEDRDADCLLLRSMFKTVEHDILHYSDPEREWLSDVEQMEAITSFRPDVVVVDLIHDSKENRLAGMRVIRKLKQDARTMALPVIAWSILFTNDAMGAKWMRRARDWGAIPISKSHPTGVTAWTFLECAGVKLRMSER